MISTTSTTIPGQTLADLGGAASAGSRAVQLGLAVFLGLFVIGMVGFSHIQVLHNANHDYRHSMAFPCH
jgi:cobalt transporter subunit CbtB